MVKKEWSYTSTAPYIFMAWCFINTWDHFTLLYHVLQNSSPQTIFNHYQISRYISWWVHLCHLICPTNKLLYLSFAVWAAQCRFSYWPLTLRWKVHWLSGSRLATLTCFRCFQCCSRRIMRYYRKMVTTTSFHVPQLAYNYPQHNPEVQYAQFFRHGNLKSRCFVWRLLSSRL
jgi:hypothetical protein